MRITNQYCGVLNSQYSEYKNNQQTRCISPTKATTIFVQSPTKYTLPNNLPVQRDFRVQSQVLRTELDRSQTISRLQALRDSIPLDVIDDNLKSNSLKSNYVSPPRNSVDLSHNVDEKPQIANILNINQLLKAKKSIKQLQIKKKKVAHFDPQQVQSFYVSNERKTKYKNQPELTFKSKNILEELLQTSSQKSLKVK
ncbi:Hypothetical_protein [Hexamita inflata]|uniref:Hypothetical_protein n=1 Tax=Hexamita inflata TaxID=28002 RepID=A0AA86NYM3_9EUKA|nr:Hypothetical protein HINF_LOCUS14784 [Hexamita inflata]